MHQSNCVTSSVAAASKRDPVAEYNRLYAISPELAHWLVWHKTSRGQFTTLQHRSWQLGIITDRATRKVIRKCSQIGMTEYAINQVFTLAAQGKSGLYVLPRNLDVGKFTPRRIDRLIKSVPYYAANCASGHKDSDSKSQKSLFGVDWQFIGSGTETNFYEVAADHLTIDEHDKCNLKNLTYAFDRLRSAHNPTWLKIGNPTVPGRGIDEQYELSTKNAWQLKCPHCNEWQELSWERNVVRQDDSGHWMLRLDQCPIYSCDAGVVCAKCERAIDRLAVGEWIAENQTAEVAGYSVSAIFGDPRSAYGHGSIRELFAAFLEGERNATAEQRFWNNLIGVPFAGDTSSITETMLLNCVDESYRMPESAKDTFIGVDVGKILHVHILAPYRDQNSVPCLEYVHPPCTVREFSDVKSLARRFDCSVGIVDGEPETRAAREMVESDIVGRWFLGDYRTGTKEAREQAENKKLAIMNRTESLDALRDMFRHRRIRLAPNYPSWDNGDFVKQMTAAVRVMDEETGRYSWQDYGKPDHHQHAANFALRAAEIGRYDRSVDMGSWV